MDIDPLCALVSQDFFAVNALIAKKLHSSVPLINNIADHIIQAGGKRLRPLLVLLASHACGYRGHEHIKLAAMLEFFHTATLLHDDVIDESSLRRGRATANQVWGNKASILVGDYLFTKYLELMVEVGDIEIIQLLVSIAPQMGAGEIQEFSNRNNTDITLDDYLEIIRAKTSLLFAASTTLGAMISHCDKKNQQDLYHFGLHFGNAFQIIDDVLDYSSDAQTLGKNIGDDLAEGKLTLPLLYALQQGTSAQKETIKTCIRQGAADNFLEIRDIITATKAIETSKQLANQEATLAREYLKLLPQSAYKTALETLCNLVVNRHC